MWIAIFGVLGILLFGSIDSDDDDTDDQPRVYKTTTTILANPINQFVDKEIEL